MYSVELVDVWKMKKATSNRYFKNDIPNGRVFAKLKEYKLLLPKTT